MDITDTHLFSGITHEEAEHMLECFEGFRRRYRAGAMIHQAGETVDTMGLVLGGSVVIELGDAWGNTSVLSLVQAGDVFGEVYGVLDREPLLVTVRADDDTEVLFLRLGMIFQTCEQNCSYHNRYMRNMMEVLATKSLHLSRKIAHTSPKTIRGRLQAYLSDEALRAGSRHFTIPFNRQELADYLNVDRSALSHELSKMQRDGLCRFHKNRFELTPESLRPPVDL